MAYDDDRGDWDDRLTEDEMDDYLDEIRERKFQRMFENKERWRNRGITDEEMELAQRMSDEYDMKGYDDE